MNILESVRMALDGLMSNKLRSILTTLGIIIGVMAVISLLSIGQGVQQQILSNIQSTGSNLIFVTAGNVSSGGVRTQAQTSTITAADADALTGVPHVIGVTAEFQSAGQLVANGINTFGTVRGVTPDYADIRNFTLTSGEFINPGHMDGRQNVAVIGKTIADTLFPDQDPIGQRIRFSNQQLTVIGTLAPKGGSGFGSQDNQIMVPLTTMQSKLATQRNVRGTNTVGTISVKVDSERNIPVATEGVINALRERRPGAFEDDFSVSTQQDILNTLSQTTQILTIFLGAIAGISLLVGGIGIMNIMLVSVTERTREIGIRKAVGATRLDILMQFLVEAVVLSLGGGLIGVAAGIGISRLLTGIQLGTTSLQTVVTPDVVVLAFLVSAAIGLFFGVYPAIRASRLNPIDALRYE